MAEIPYRPTLREIFLTKDRQAEILFYTSDVSKYVQARVVFERAGLKLKHWRSEKEPSAQDCREEREYSIVRAISQALENGIGPDSLFFVEETSLRIESLSAGKKAYPGPQVNGWFARTSFEQLDQQLKAQGIDRRAEITSDIALHIPGFRRPVLFSEQTRGRVAETPPMFQENLRYPWLAPSTFNGWFIPDGTTRRIGEMGLEESWRHDSRIRALEVLISRLEEYTAVLNLPKKAYFERQPLPPVEQLQLFPATILVVVGDTCSGKTTFGDRAHDEYDFLHIEASAVVRMLQRNVTLDNMDTADVTKRLLTESGTDIVARTILRLYSSQFYKGLVLTGFRTSEALDLLASHFANMKVVYLKADEGIRFQRLLQRGRSPDCRTIEDFREIDAQQSSFGLLRVAADLADIRLINEGGIDYLHMQIDAVLRGTYDVAGITIQDSRNRGYEVDQLLRYLRVLQCAGRPMSSDEIEREMARTGSDILHSDADNMFERVPELVRKLALADMQVRYELLIPGRAYLHYMQRVSRC